MTDIAALFYVGVIIPTLVTIITFSGFLICWFKCGLRRRLRAGKEGETSLIQRAAMVNWDSIQKKYRGKSDNRSQQSNDSAIDVGEMELGFDDVDRTKGKSEVIIDAKSFKSFPKHSYENEMVMTEVDVHTNLKKGIYPSKETLNVEIRSQAKIYESVEDAQMYALKIAASHDDGADNRPSTSTQSTLSHKTDLIHAAQKQFSKSVGGTLQKPPRYTSTNQLIGTLPKQTKLVAQGLNDDSNYAIVPTWLHHSQKRSESARKNTSSLYVSKEYQPSNLSWKPNIVASGGSNTDNYSTVEASQV